MMDKTRLGGVVAINPDSVTQDFPYQEIEYIEISSVGSGTLEATKTIAIDEAPSRAKRLVQDGDTILSTVRPNRRSFLYIKNPLPNTVVSTGFAVLRASDAIDERFLYYVVNHQAFTDYITARAKGAAYPAVDTDTIADAEIPLPSLLIQRKIAGILSAYDDLIENNSRRIKILEEMAQTIYREWFVNFRFPDHEKVKMIDSTFGKIPEGWDVKKLGEVIELAYGKALKAADRKRGAVPVYGSSGIVGYHDTALVRGPTIVIGRKGNVGSVYWSESDCYPIDTVFYVRTTLCLYFIFYALQDQHFINSDAAVPGLSRNQAYTLLFLVPPQRVLTKFKKVAKDLFQIIRNLEERNAVLRRTRDLLLPKLISGELDVSELDIEIRGKNI